MCGHEIKWKGGIFVMCMYQGQHFQRDKCKSYLTEWYPPKKLMFDSTIGIYQECIIENGSDEYNEENYEEGFAGLDVMLDTACGEMNERSQGYIVDNGVEGKHLDSWRI